MRISKMSGFDYLQARQAGLQTLPEILSSAPVYLLGSGRRLSFPALKRRTPKGSG